MLSRFLITTADERSWKFDRPVLFLGEWCRRYERKQVWEKMDTEVAEPCGLQSGQKERDLIYVQELSSRLLSELVDALNAFHATNHSLRYWNIVLGHWVQRCVAILFNRYFTLEHALQKYEISGSLIFDAAEHHLSTPDSGTLITACNDDVWNHVLYSRVLNYFGSVTTEVDSHSLRGISGFSEEKVSTSAKKRNFKHVLKKIAYSFLPKLSKKKDAFIINSYLPRIEETKLQLLLGQFPQFWLSPALAPIPPNITKRQILKMNADGFTGFEKFVRSQLCEMIPTCYVEGYQQLMRQVSSLPWPAAPRFIFTSNNYNADEIFKAWTGLKVEEGIPYYVGQHGNLYGAEIGSQNYPEIATCDRFIAWGSVNGNPKTVPAFVFKIVGRKKQDTSENGGLLLIEVHPPHLLTPWDSYYEYEIYQEEQFRFVDALPWAIRQKMTIRLHQGYKNFRWFDEQRWKDHNPRINVETGLVKIQKLIAKSRLVVHSYDSTGILETLALNIPTLCFWNGGLDHLLSSAKPYYELLRSVGILADTPEQAAKLVSLHWDNISEWWKNKKIQDARKAFCEQYARMEKNPIQTMKRLLTAHEKGI